MRIYLRVFMLALACLSLPLIGKAQGSIGGNPYGYYGNGYGYRSSAADYYNPYSSSVSRHMRTVASRSRTQSSMPRNSPQRAPVHRSTVTPHAVAGASTSFRPVSPQPIAPRKLAEKQANGSPERVRELEEFYTFTLKGYESIARSKGAPLNDIARAMNYFIHSNYMVCHGGQGMTDEQFAGLSSFVRESLLEDEEFQRLGARDKQEMYEMLAIMGGVTLNGYTYGREHKNSQLQSEMQTLAKGLLESMLDTPLDKVRFTANGIEY